MLTSVSQLVKIEIVYISGQFDDVNDYVNDYANDYYVCAYFYILPLCIYFIYVIHVFIYLKFLLKVPYVMSLFS